MPSKPPRPDTKTFKQNADGKPAGVTGSNATPQKDKQNQYEEAQNDEIQVLQSIFMDDFEQVETKGAWSKKSDRSFKIHIRVSSETTKPDTIEAKACLYVTLTATYPKTLPLLSVKDTQNVQGETTGRINHVLSSKPKELLKHGEVMILEIAYEIERVMMDAVDAQAQGLAIPSLEEERAAHEAEADALARKEKETATRRLEEEKAEEDRTMQQMLEEQMKRQDDLQLKRAVSEMNDDEVRLSGQGDLHFEEPVSVLMDNGKEIRFREIVFTKELHSGKLSTIYEVIPVIIMQQQQPDTSTSMVKPVPQKSLALRRTRVKCRAKKSFLDLADSLEKLRTLRHPSIVNVHDFKIEKDNDGWQFDILMDFCSRGSLLNMLETFGSLPLSRARSFTIELLEALDFYHKNGIAHGSVSAKNILLFEATSTNVSFKLANAAVEYGLNIITENFNGAATKDTLNSPWPSPESLENIESKTHKSDVWDLGTLIVQMILGLGTCERYPTPLSFMNNAGLTEPFKSLLREAYRIDPKKRALPLDIIPSEFLRTEAEAVCESTKTSVSFERRHSNYQQSSMHDSAAKGLSRFSNEFEETGHIGKGGFGEVVKARNKLDGRIYAVKKISGKTPAEITEVLSEVRHLAILNHPYVVRYYQAWQEQESSPDPSFSEGSEVTSTSESKAFEHQKSSFDVGHSTGGLDFISSSGYPKIEFGEDDDDDYNEDDDNEDENDRDDNDQKLATNSNDDLKDVWKRKKKGNEAIQHTRGPSNSSPNHQDLVTKSTLFIQMEYCERRTLRGLINKGLHENMDEVWRLFRQILEGLVHIHSFGMIHRDLKPENIFLDIGDNPKIGDFGLATVGLHPDLRIQVNPRVGDSIRPTVDEMTRDIGTALYVAPELCANESGTYTEKVDMFSLGIIFFEMCYPSKTGMERIEVLGSLRAENSSLPEVFRNEKQKQGSIIESLINHKPSERPKSAELLRSDMLPLKIEDEHIRLALQSVSDPSAPYYHRMMSALFSHHANRQVMDKLWDIGGNRSAPTLSTNYTLLQGLAKDKLVSVFRRHGALESSRQGLIPRASYYTSNNVAELIDRSGALVQLPFDLTLPFARTIAQQTHVAEKSYAFGMVFREASTGVAPRSIGEVDFDIVSYDTKDLALKEAEMIRVLDEILDEFPSFHNTPMCFHISHCILMDMILGFCRIAPAQQQAAKEVLGKLNIHPWTWQKIRAELRSPAIGLSLTSLDELAQFDFRDTIEKSFSRLQSVFIGTPHLQTLHRIFTHISGLDEYLKRSGIRRKVYFSPLASYSDKFYRGNVMFQLLYDTKKRDVLAAGGRYDKLIEDHRPRFFGSVPSTYQPALHAVGVNIAWDRLVSSMARYQKQAGSQFLKKSLEPEMPGLWASRRCDVLIASFDSTVLRSVGWKMVNDLWAHDISAELAVDTRAPEELLAHYKDDKHSWIVIIKHEAYTSGKPDLKIKNMDKREETDLHSAALMNYLRGEIRERDQRESSNQRAKLLRGSSRSDNTAAPASGKKGQVQVLMASHKSKKANKWRVVEAAQAKAQEHFASFADSPIASVETRDEVLDLIRETRLSDVESWRKIAQEVIPSEREYVWQIHELLDRFKMQHKDTNRKCFVYNFRTGTGIDYDLLL